MKLKVKDVMTKDVVVVTEPTPFKEMVALIEGKRVTALPVVDAERYVIGVVSEADLLLKEEFGPEGNSGRPRLGRRRVERSKATGRTAAQVMSAPPVVIHAEDPLGAAARVMHRNGVKRLPVVNADGRLEGIVSRADLLRVFLRTDEEIRVEIEEHVLRRALGAEPTDVRVTVDDGVVTLRGQLERASLLPLARELVVGVDGVVGVQMHLGYRIDDSRVHVVAGPWSVFTPDLSTRS